MYKYELGETIDGVEIIGRFIVKDERPSPEVYYFLNHKSCMDYYNLSSSDIERWLNLKIYLDIEFIGNISDYFGKLISWRTEKELGH